VAGNDRLPRSVPLGFAKRERLLHNWGMRRQAAILIPVALLLLGCSGSAVAQTQTQTRPKPATPPVQAPPAPAPKAPAPSPQEQPPSADSLGVPPFHQAMHFIESFDAGGGQRFYLFGANASFSDIVAYYQSVLKQRGELVFDEPAVHMFDLIRFREETMTFPPSVTVKDYTWGGMQGYPNPKPNAEPARFRTVVQIVPIPAATLPVKK
jgi:hypothetical protein